MAELKSFSLDPDMIMKLIFGQAGTQAKAFLESIMNSVDSGSTYIKIDFNTDGSGYTIEDDGCGFKTRDEVIELFGCFGWDHSKLENNKREFGSFGLGRAQHFGFGSQIWLSNEFTLDVDVKQRGLDYLLTAGTETLHKGCKITGTYYERPSALELNNIVRELGDMAKFAPIPVIVNGRTINKPAAGEKWHFVDDDAYYKLDSSSRLVVYNLGVMVRSFNASELGCGGVVVTRKHCELNIARNDILNSKCKIWKRIKQVIRSKAVDDASSKSVRLNNERREALVRSFIAGEISWSDIAGINVLPALKGYVGFWELFNNHTYCKWTIADDTGDSLGESIHINREACVLSPVVREWFNYDSDEEIVAKIERVFPSRGENGVKFNFVDYKTLTKGYSREAKPIPSKDLNLKQQAVLQGCEIALNYLRPALFHKTGEKGFHRRISAGILKGSKAWTDGSTYIAFNIDVVNEAVKNEAAFSNMLMILCHEICHGEPTFGAHNHGEEFYELFHDVMLDCDYPATLNAAIRGAKAVFTRKKKKAPVWMQRAASKGTLDDEIPEIFPDEVE